MQDKVTITYDAFTIYTRTTSLDETRQTVEYVSTKNDIVVSDGHHTMTELYEHRHALFCALCKIYDNYITPLNTRITCWKSRLHDDGTMFEGWFIAGMTIKQLDGPPKYITYHLPESWWNKFNLIVLDKAPEWDGHDSNEVIKRLGQL